MKTISVLALVGTAAGLKIEPIGECPPGTPPARITSQADCNANSGGRGVTPINNGDWPYGCFDNKHNTKVWFNSAYENNPDFMPNEHMWNDANSNFITMLDCSYELSEKRGYRYAKVVTNHENRFNLEKCTLDDYDSIMTPEQCNEAWQLEFPELNNVGFQIIENKDWPIGCFVSEFHGKVAGKFYNKGHKDATQKSMKSHLANIKHTMCKKNFCKCNRGQVDWNVKSDKDISCCSSCNKGFQFADPKNKYKWCDAIVGDAGLCECHNGAIHGSLKCWSSHQSCGSCDENYELMWNPDGGKHAWCTPKMGGEGLCQCDNGEVHDGLRCHSEHQSCKVCKEGYELQKNEASGKHAWCAPKLGYFCGCKNGKASTDKRCHPSDSTEDGKQTSCGECDTGFEQVFSLWQGKPGAHAWCQPKMGEGGLCQCSNGEIHSSTRCSSVHQSCGSCQEGYSLQKKEGGKHAWCQKDKTIKEAKTEGPTAMTAMTGKPTRGVDGTFVYDGKSWVSTKMTWKDMDSCTDQGWDDSCLADEWSCNMRHNTDKTGKGPMFLFDAAEECCCGNREVAPEKKCNPEECAEWLCVDWCNCFKAEPKIIEIFEGLKPSQSDLDLRKLCPADNNEFCDCTELLDDNTEQSHKRSSTEKTINVEDLLELLNPFTGKNAKTSASGPTSAIATLSGGCEDPMVKCFSPHGYHCTTKYQCNLFNGHPWDKDDGYDR